MTAAPKIDLRLPLIAEIQVRRAPSSVHQAFIRAGLGAVSALGWAWNAAALRKKDIEELRQILRIMDRSTHIAEETA